PVDLATIPLYVRAGAIIATGPVKQHTGEAVDAPLTLTIYPGANGAAIVYEDDGSSFTHESGGYRKIVAAWHDGARRLVLSPGDGSNQGAAARRFSITVANTGAARDSVFDGKEQ